MTYSFDEEFAESAAKTRSPRPGPAARAWIWGLAASAVFLATALALTITGYAYGALLGIAPEYPLMLSTSFVVVALLVVAAAPVIAVLLARFGDDVDRPPAGSIRGAVLGAAVMSLIWLWYAGAGVNPLEWPHLLYLLQISLSAAAGGALLEATSRSNSNSDVAGLAKHIKIVMVSAAIFLIILMLPFLHLWLAKRSFQIQATREAAAYFQLPPEMVYTLADEGSGVESLQANQRYKVTGTAENNGKKFTVNIIGERHGNVVEVKEIYGYLQVAADDLPITGVAVGLGSDTQIQQAVLELACTYVNVPLAVTSTGGGGFASQFVTMRGNGLEVTARPTSASRDQAGLHLSFSTGRDN
ncbi:MAG: hypothetical protein ACYC0L_09415 [Thermoleophilia bacterium]